MSATHEDGTRSEVMLALGMATWLIGKAASLPNLFGFFIFNNVHSIYTQQTDATKIVLPNREAGFHPIDVEISLHILHNKSMHKQGEPQTLNGGTLTT